MVTGLDPCDDPKDYETLTDGQKRALEAWIRLQWVPRKRNLLGAGCSMSYSMSNNVSQQAHAPFPVTNGQFKGAMLAAGFETTLPSPARDRDQNWDFRCGWIQPFYVRAGSRQTRSARALHYAYLTKLRATKDLL